MTGVDTGRTSPSFTGGTPQPPRRNGVPPLFAESDDVPMGVVFRNLLRAVWRYRVTVLVTFVLVTIAVILAVRMLPPTYEARAEVLVRTETQGNPSFLTGVAALSPRGGFDSPERRLETEMQLAASRPVIEAAVRERHATYNQVYHTPLTHVLQPALSVYEWVMERFFGYPPSDRESESNVVDAVQKSLVVGPVKTKSAEVTSNLIALELPAADREVARDLLAAIVRHYQRLQNTLTERAATEALRVLGAEQRDAETQATRARGQLRRYLGTPGGERGGVATMSSPRDGQTLDRLKARLLETEMALADARNLYTDGADTIVRLQQRVTTLRSRANAEIGLDAAASTSVDDLERDLRVAEARQEELSRRTHEIELLAHSDTLLSNDRVVVEEPRTPKSSDWKKRLAIMVAGTVAGLALGFVFAGLRYAASHTLHSADDVRQLLGTAPIGVVPRATAAALSQALAPSGKPGRNQDRRATLVPALRLLSTRVQALVDGGATPRGRVVLVTSARPGEGKSVVARALAAYLRDLSGARVILVDGEGTSARGGAAARTPTPAVAFAAAPAGGESVPASAVSTDDAPDATLLYDATRFASFASDAARRHDWVIVDAPAISTGLAEPLARHADLALLVVDAQRTGRQLVSEVLGDLATNVGVPAAVVLNKTEPGPPARFFDRL